MKKNTSLIVLMTVAIISISSCSNDVKEFTGDYSYKTSGSVVLTNDEGDNTIVLPDRIGQLNIIDLKSEDKDSALLVFNEINGGVRYVHASVTDDEIEIVPYQWTTSIASVGTLNITVSGSGKRYNNTIVFTESYSGTYTTDSKEGTIESDNIKTLATRN